MKTFNIIDGVTPLTSLAAIIPYILSTLF